MKNKKGIGFEIEKFLLMFIVLIIIVGAIIVVGIMGPIVFGTGTEVLNSVKDVATTASDGNIKNATDTSITIAEGTINSFEYFVYIMFIGLTIGFLVVAYNVKAYPGLAPMWFILVILLTIAAVIFSNYYQEMQSGIYSDYYSQWTMNDYIMEYLPYIVAVMGTVGGIVLFALSRDREQLSEEALF